MKKYNTFEEFNTEAENLLTQHSNILCYMNESEQVVFLRQNIDKKILVSYIVISKLTCKIQNFLESKSNILNFSLDNYLKNKIMHPEITIEDYLNIPNIITQPSKILKSKNGCDVILFQGKDKYYKLVIKSTTNKDENFVKSLHLLNYDRYRKYIK